MVEITEPSQSTVEMKEASQGARRMEGGIPSDPASPFIPFLIMCLLVVGVLCASVAGLRYLDEHPRQRPAVTSEFDQEFYDYCMKTLGQADDYCFWHSVG